MEQRILSYLKEHESEIFADLEKLVRAEASTADVKELEVCRAVLSEIVMKRLGIKTELVATNGDHPLLTFSYGSGEEKVVLVGHYDTVCPIGSMEFRKEGNELHGPGVLDMKSGLISAIWTMKSYQALEIDPGKKVTVIMNGDEEKRSPESSDIICELSRGAKAAFICEPSTSNGDLKTGRKGSIGFWVTIHGKSTHAGNDHKGGINAIEEMAREIQFVHSLTDYEVGTTLNVGVCSGGTKGNVVPNLATFEVDCRYLIPSEGERIKNLISGYTATVPGTIREVKVDTGLPPMEQTEGNLRLFELAKKCGQELELSFSHKLVGGGSDGNKLSAMGIPTLDGMGAVGDGAHGVNEHLVIDRYIPRIALLASTVAKV